MQILLICDIADRFQGAARGPHKKLDQLMHNSTEKAFFFLKINLWKNKPKFQVINS